MSRSTIRILGLLALVTVLLVVGHRAWERSVATLAVQQLCADAERGNWERVLTAPVPPKSSREVLLMASECRCLALRATDRADTCNEELETLLSDSRQKAWVPIPELSEALIRSRQSRGESQSAAVLAKQAASTFPDHLGLRILELESRIAVEEPEAVLNSLERRLPRDPFVRQQFRIWLADRGRRLGLAERALTLLGPSPVSASPDVLFSWHEHRARSLAQLGRSAEFEASIASWLDSSENQADVRALYALILEKERLEPPDGDVPSLLLSSGREMEDIADPWIREAIYRRVIMGLASAGRADQALPWYDQARREFPLAGLDRSELEREASRPKLEQATKNAGALALSFVVEPPIVGATLELSPPPDRPVDHPWSSHAMPNTGVLVLQRMADSYPLRWVLRDPVGKLMGSGAAWVREGAQVTITPEESSSGARQPAPYRQAAADGLSRLFVVLPDCGDWRLIQYLRMRRELPVLNSLLETGYRAVLDSNPPFTGAALRSLVHPGGDTGSSVLSVLHELGAELEGLASVPTNPLDALRWVLPRRDDFFSTLGRGPLRAANLLYAHGKLAAGHHARLVGPEGAEGRLAVGRSSRPLSGDEAVAFPELAALPPEIREHVERIAAEMDAVVDLARSDAPEVVLLRLESLDLLTHSRYSEVADHKQDNGRGALLAAYRYMDARLGELHGRLDGDDTLVVVSDHGIRTAMKHSRQAFFVAVGPTVPRGRSPGQPHFRGLAQALARMAGVETSWPDTGLLWSSPSASDP